MRSHKAKRIPRHQRDGAASMSFAMRAGYQSREERVARVMRIETGSAFITDALGC